MDSNKNKSDTEDANSEIRKTIFSFRRTHEAAVRNSQILSTFKGELGEAISAQKDIPVNYGSEFRDIAALAKLFFYHGDRNNIFNII